MKKKINVERVANVIAIVFTIIILICGVIHSIREDKKEKQLVNSLSTEVKNMNELIIQQNETIQTLNDTVFQMKTDLSYQQGEIEQLADTVAEHNTALTATSKKSSTALPSRSGSTRDRGSVSYTDKNTDLREFSDITVGQMNEWIDNMAPSDSPFRNNGAIFIKAANESGLDPRYILAHAAIESGWGRSNICKTKHNYFGIAAYDSNTSAAYNMGNGLENGIINGANWIAKNYTNKDQETLYKMIYGKKQYASTADKWISDIESIMKRCK